MKCTIYIVKAITKLAHVHIYVMTSPRREPIAFISQYVFLAVFAVTYKVCNCYIVIAIWLIE